MEGRQPNLSLFWRLQMSQNKRWTQPMFAVFVWTITSKAITQRSYVLRSLQNILSRRGGQPGFHWGIFVPTNKPQGEAWHAVNRCGGWSLEIKTTNGIPSSMKLCPPANVSKPRDSALMSAFSALSAPKLALKSTTKPDRVLRSSQNGRQVIQCLSASVGLCKYLYWLRMFKILGHKMYVCALCFQASIQNMTRKTVMFCVLFKIMDNITMSVCFCGSVQIPFTALRISQNVTMPDLMSVPSARKPWFTANENMPQIQTQHQTFLLSEFWMHHRHTSILARMFVFAFRDIQLSILCLPNVSKWQCLNYHLPYSRPPGVEGWLQIDLSIVYGMNRCWFSMQWCTSSAPLRLFLLTSDRFAMHPQARFLCPAPTCSPHLLCHNNVRNESQWSDCT